MRDAMKPPLHRRDDHLSHAVRRERPSHRNRHPTRHTVPTLGLTKRTPCRGEAGSSVAHRRVRHVASLRGTAEVMPCLQPRRRAATLAAPCRRGLVCSRRCSLAIERAPPSSVRRSQPAAAGGRRARAASGGERAFGRHAACGMPSPRRGGNGGGGGDRRRRRRRRW